MRLKGSLTALAELIKGIQDCLAHLKKMPPETQTFDEEGPLFRNYWTVAVRNLLRHKAYSVMNVLGLAIGMACVILIGLYVRHELSYDAVHRNGDRIYRVLRSTESSDGSVTMSAGTSGPLAEALRQAFPEVETTVRRMGWGGVWVRSGERGFYQRFNWADPKILEVFDFPLVKGDPKTALSEPHTVVITEEMAQKFFGDGDPIGKVITVDNKYFVGDYTITGVARDIPENVQFQFDFLSASMHPEFPQRYWRPWRAGTSYRPIITYVLLKEGADPKILEDKMQALIAQYMGEEIAAKNAYHLQPFNRVYLYSTADYGEIVSYVDSDYAWHGDIQQVYLFSAIGLFILCIACINFMNLATARSANRAREVGMRKVVGAHRGQIRRQFLSESVLLAFLGLVGAIGLTFLALPTFNAFTGKTLSLWNCGWLLLFLPVLALGVGMLAGAYPAFFLSAFEPVAVLKGQPSGKTRGAWLRKGLVVFQFAISIVLIVGTLGVYRQWMFMQNRKLGFDKEHIVMVPLFHRDPSLNTRYREIKAQFLQHRGILKAAVSATTMGTRGELHTVVPEGTEGENWQMQKFSVDEDFLDLYNIPLIAGRNFSADQAQDATHAYILNETAIRKLGWKAQEAVGKRFRWGAEGYVIGVVKDFNYRSLHTAIEPTFVHMWIAKWSTISLKIAPGKLPEVLPFLEEKWHQYVPQFPFAYAFVDETMNRLYEDEQRFGKLAGIFAVLAISVACLGLFGLASFMAEQRTKEVGIRKVLGASTAGIVAMLSVDFLKLVVVANFLAWPVAYAGLQAWLTHFAYRISPGVSLFALGGLLAFGIALATVSGQAVRAGRTRPVDAMRYE